MLAACSAKIRFPGKKTLLRSQNAEEKAGKQWRDTDQDLPHRTRVDQVRHQEPGLSSVLYDKDALEIYKKYGPEGRDSPLLKWGIRKMLQ